MLERGSNLVITTAGKLEQLQATIETVIRGKSEVVELALVTLLAGGHLLIEDVPGVGKTTLAHTLARSFDCTFQRIQFTSDMLPSDIVGLEVFDQQVPARQKSDQGKLHDIGLSANNSLDCSLELFKLTGGGDH